MRRLGIGCLIPSFILVAMGAGFVAQVYDWIVGTEEFELIPGSGKVYLLVEPP